MFIALLLVGVVRGPAGNFDLTDATAYRPQRQRGEVETQSWIAFCALFYLCQDSFNMKALNFLSEISLGELFKKNFRAVIEKI